MLAPEHCETRNSSGIFNNSKFVGVVHVRKAKIQNTVFMENVTALHRKYMCIMRAAQPHIPQHEKMQMISVRYGICAGDDDMLLLVFMMAILNRQRHNQPLSLKPRRKTTKYCSAFQFFNGNAGR